jgi:hypothetical protein
MRCHSLKRANQDLLDWLQRNFEFANSIGEAVTRGKINVVFVVQNRFQRVF